MSNKELFDWSSLDTDSLAELAVSRLVWVYADGRRYLKLIPKSHFVDKETCWADGSIVPWFEAKEFI